MQVQATDDTIAFILNPVEANSLLETIINTRISENHDPMTGHHDSDERTESIRALGSRVPVIVLEELESFVYGDVDES